MKFFSARLLVASALVLPATFATAACSDTTTVDSESGKAISDVDIGADFALNRGETQQATATVAYADGTKSDVTKSSDLVWNIGNTDVATISADGMVTAKNLGATTIKAIYQGKESTSKALVVK